MGMYDYMNDEQVKCFYKVVFSEDYGTWHSGGSLNCYSNGDRLPLKTLYYRYPENFIVFDYTEAFNECIIHIIKDSKLYKTCNIEDMKDEYFKGNDSVVGKYGSPVYNIASKFDMEEYICETKALAEKIKELGSDERFVHSEYMKSLRRIQAFEREKASINVFGLVTEKEFGALKDLIIMGLGIDEYKSLKFVEDSKKEELIRDDNFMNSFSLALKNMLSDEFDRLSNVHDEKVKERNELERPFRERYCKKWHIEERFKLEKQFGEYLEVVNRLFASKDEENPYDDNYKKYSICKERFEIFIRENEDIVLKYAQWVGVDKHEIDLLLQSLL